MDIMCLATPVKIIKIKGSEAIVLSGKKKRIVNLHLLEKKPRVGDYLLAHSDLAINTLEKKDALEILDLNQEISECQCSK